MILACKIPLRFDSGRLREELARVAPGDWRCHFNTREYEGDWSGVALRAPIQAGVANPLLSGLYAGSEFADTPILGRCAYFREVLAAFHCPIKSARLLKLGPGARIREHRDYDLGLDDGEARVHIPVATNPSVEFLLDGRRVVMGEGEAWYLELNRPHCVRNRGTTDRVHLVVDCVANPWFHAQLAAGDESVVPAGEEGLQDGGFDEFRELVLSDLALQDELDRTSDPKHFVVLAVRLGGELGFTFCASDVEDAMRTARRAWIERGIK